MYRFEALSRAIWNGVPEAAAAPLGVVTALGGASFLMVALAVLYWVGDRRETATVVSYAFVAIAVVVAVKAGIGLPRPPESARLIPFEGDPYGFPSGHAVASVVVYGGLASVHGRLRDRRVAVGVAAVVGLVAFSRVALGVHYVGDVVAGVALGIVILAVCRRAVASDPRRGFALATVLAVPALLVTGGSPEALLAFGGSLGGVVGSWSLRGAVDSTWLEAPDRPRSRPQAGALVLVGVPFLFGLDALAESLDAAVVTIGVYAVLVAGILLLPAVASRASTSVFDRARG